MFQRLINKFTRKIQASVVNAIRTRHVVTHIFSQIFIVALLFIFMNKPEERYGEASSILFSLVFIALCLIGYFIAYLIIPRAKTTSKQVIKTIGRSTFIFWVGLLVSIALIDASINAIHEIRAVSDKRQDTEDGQARQLYTEKHFRELYAQNKDYQFLWRDSRTLGMVSPTGDTMVVKGFEIAEANPEIVSRTDIYNKHPINDTSYWLAKGLEINKIFIQDSTFTYIKRIENLKITRVSPLNYIMRSQNYCFEMSVSSYDEEMVSIICKINQNCCKNCVIKHF
jgi:heme/copper-type cytochrome/quinol oxidase subunit 4